MSRKNAHAWGRQISGTLENQTITGHRTKHVTDLSVQLSVGVKDVGEWWTGGHIPSCQLNLLNSLMTLPSEAKILIFHFFDTAQWLRGRASDSRQREPGFETCAVVLIPWASFFILHCSSSLSWINEYLAIDSGGYVYEQPSRSNCGMAGCFPEKPRWCLGEQVCQGSKV